MFASKIFACIDFPLFVRTISDADAVKFNELVVLVETSCNCSWQCVFCRNQAEVGGECCYCVYILFFPGRAQFNTSILYTYYLQHYYLFALFTNDYTTRHESARTSHSIQERRGRMLGMEEEYAHLVAEFFLSYLELKAIRFTRRFDPRNCQRLSRAIT